MNVNLGRLHDRWKGPHRWSNPRPSFFRWNKEDPEKLRNLPKVTLVLRRMGKIDTLVLGGKIQDSFHCALLFLKGLELGIKLELKRDRKYRGIGVGRLYSNEPSLSRKWHESWVPSILRVLDLCENIWHIQLSPWETWEKYSKPGPSSNVPLFNPKGPKEVRPSQVHYLWAERIFGSREAQDQI